MSDDLSRLAGETALDARSYLATVTTVASGESPDTAIPLLLLAVSRVLAAGARLGAITDVVPDERYEADPGPDADVDPLRQGLANVFEGLDDYAFVVDPLLGVEVARGSLSGDLAELRRGPDPRPAALDAGRVTEALWWWQFSYLSVVGRQRRPHPARPAGRAHPHPPRRRRRRRGRGRVRRAPPLTGPSVADSCRPGRSTYHRCGHQAVARRQDQ